MTSLKGDEEEVVLGVVEVRSISSLVVVVSVRGFLGLDFVRGDTEAPSPGMAGTWSMVVWTGSMSLCRFLFFLSFLSLLEGFSFRASLSPANIVPL